MQGRCVCVAGMGLADSRFSASSMNQESIFSRNPHYSFKCGFILILYIRKLRFSKIIYLAQIYRNCQW